MIMHYQLLFSFILLLVLWTTSECFVIQPQLRTNTLLHATEAPVVKDKKKEKQEKFTKEAQELLDEFDAAKEKGTYLIAQVAPSVRVAFAEEFGCEPGTYSPGQLVASLRKLGFDLVLDTNTAADITIFEEGTELLHRLRAAKERQPFGDATNQHEPLPMFTSCCPGWMAFVEKSAPELANYISSCKSPHMMYGSLVKEFSEELIGKDKKDIYFTSVMPCVRKRGESDQECFVRDDGIREIDNVVTTKDIGMLMRMKGIKPDELEPEPFDSPFQIDGEGSGAGQLFGATGGVMEAALRTVYEVVTKKKMEKLDLHQVRGFDGVKEAIVSLDEGEFCKDGKSFDLRVAVCNGLGNAKQLIKKMKDGEVEYDFVEVMACPGGCIGGGGQPKGDKEAPKKRLEATYSLDSTRKIRRSHENPAALAFYTDKYLGEEFGSETAHKLLHVDPVYKKHSP